MNKVTQNFARMIDLSAVQAFNTQEEILKHIELAVHYNIISIHVLPNWASFVNGELIKRSQKDTYIGGPVGFPSGGHATQTKVFEAKKLMEDGAKELDMVVNIGRVLSGDYDFIYNDIKAVADAVHPFELKVILEVHYLNEQQIRTVCDLAIKAGAKWIKTATGWAPTGASVEKVKIIADAVDGRINIKAAGGIREFELVRDLYKLGVRRFGLSYATSEKILLLLEQEPKAFPELE